MSEVLRYSKIRDVNSPTRAHAGDAGVDLYVPNDGKQYDIYPGNSVLIPSGIKVDVPYGYALIAFNKSGVASKKHLDLLACVIDHQYQGEVFINLINVGVSKTHLDPGDKMAQLILVPIALPEFVEVPIEELHKEESSRGEGGFGSTDKT